MQVDAILCVRVDDLLMSATLVAENEAQCCFHGSS